MAGKRTVLLVGGPDAGKTNFLVRLWIALYARTGILHADGLPEDAEYLNTGSQTLLGGSFVPRTSQEVHNRNVIPVMSSGEEKGFRGELVVPDCSGEEWMRIYRNREWSEAWESLIPSLWGCLLFVRAGSDRVCAPLDWVTCVELYGSPESLPDAPANASGEVPVPTQVVLVDWIQCLRAAVTARGGGPARLRVGVVVAAWDRVPRGQQDQSPDHYLAANFPLLHQFMASNPDRFLFEGFGLSVVGGDLTLVPRFKEQYLQGTPSESGFVVHTLGGAVERSQDHTLPVAWAMGLDVPRAGGRGKRTP